MNITLALDFDDAGRAATIRIAKAIQEYNDYVVTHPFIYKHPDPNATEQQQADYDMDMFKLEWDWYHEKLELAWVKPVVGSIPKKEVEWLSIFPEAKKKYKGLIGGQLKVKGKYLMGVIEKSKKFWATLMMANPHDTEFLKMTGREHLTYLRQMFDKVESQIRHFKSIGRKKDPNSKRVDITLDMISRAKAYPLNKLIEINRQGFTKCFAHNDKKPSAYCKKNFIYCFVCNRSFDTIDVLMVRDGKKYIDAVLELCQN